MTDVLGTVAAQLLRLEQTVNASSARDVRIEGIVTSAVRWLRVAVLLLVLVLVVLAYAALSVTP